MSEQIINTTALTDKQKAYTNDGPYEQGKADGAKEMWEKFCNKCIYDYDNHSCNSNPIKLMPKSFENCPIAKGGK